VLNTIRNPNTTTEIRGSSGIMKSGGNPLESEGTESSFS
jgi:hypothetical protein